MGRRGGQEAPWHAFELGLLLAVVMLALLLGTALLGQRAFQQQVESLGAIGEVLHRLGGLAGSPAPAPVRVPVDDGLLDPESWVTETRSAQEGLARALHALEGSVLEEAEFVHARVADLEEMLALAGAAVAPQEGSTTLPALREQYLARWSILEPMLRERLADVPLRLVYGPERLHFPTGEAVPANTEDNRRALAALQLEALERVIQGYRSIRIEGHTDNVPIRTERFRDNLELSTARAAWLARLVRHSLEQSGLVPGVDFLVSAAGFGEDAPVVRHGRTQPEPRNRRIEVVFVKGELR